jgi:Na+-driven multidrug efflux pump
VLIPSRPLIKIASVLIADGWKSNDHAKIDEIYKKSNIVLTIVALLMFFGLWINIDHVFKIIGEEYIAGKYVILLVGLANVFEMSTSVSQYIINNSAYYKVITWFLLLFVVLLIISNAILIPLYGITGCAIAAVISRFVYNFLSWLFLYRKFGFQPFNLKYILLIFISLISFGLAWIIPQFSNFIIDMIVRSSVFVLLFGSGVLLSKLSPDLNETFTGSLRKLKIIK